VLESMRRLLGEKGMKNSSKLLLALFAATIIAFASGCVSSNDPGWMGSGAEPFDSARSQCETESRGKDAGAFEACMALKGWHRAQ